MTGMVLMTGSLWKQKWRWNQEASTRKTNNTCALCADPRPCDSCGHLIPSGRNTSWRTTGRRSELDRESQTASHRLSVHVSRHVSVNTVASQTRTSDQRPLSQARHVTKTLSPSVSLNNYVHLLVSYCPSIEWSLARFELPFNEWRSGGAQQNCLQ